MEQQTKWIEFVIQHKPENRKTDIYLVQTKGDNPITIGCIKWYGSFRKYSFFPYENTVFENQCLKDIANFLEHLMKERRTSSEPDQRN